MFITAATWSPANSQSYVECMATGTGRSERDQCELTLTVPGSAQVQVGVTQPGHGKSVTVYYQTWLNQTRSPGRSPLGGTYTTPAVLPWSLPQRQVPAGDYLHGEYLVQLPLLIDGGGTLPTFTVTVNGVPSGFHDGTATP